MNSQQQLTAPARGQALRELLRELARLEAAAADFSQDRATIGPLSRLLDQAELVLEILDSQGARLLVVELSALARAIHEEAVVLIDEARQTLGFACTALLQHLQQLQHRADDPPLALLALLNDLRASRGASLYAGVALSVKLPDIEPSSSAALRACVQAQRPVFVRALLGWLRRQSPEQHLAQMHDALRAVSDASQATRDYWLAASALCEALQWGRLRSRPALRMVLSALERALRELENGGEAALLRSDALHFSDVLYYVALSAEGGGTYTDLATRYPLHVYLPEHESHPQYLNTVREALVLELEESQQALESALLLQREAQNAKLKPLLAQWLRVAETCELLGQGDVAEQLRVAVVAAQGALQQPEQLDDVLASLADSVLRCQQSLGVTPKSLSGSSDSGEMSTCLPPLLQRWADADARALAGAVAGETQRLLARAHDPIAQACFHPSSTSPYLQDAALALGQGATALEFLGDTAASAQVAALAQELSLMSADPAPLASSATQRLAEAVAALELYLDSLASLAPVAAWLDISEQQLHYVTAAQSVPYLDATLPVQDAEREPGAARSIEEGTQTVLRPQGGSDSHLMSHAGDSEQDAEEAGLSLRETFIEEIAQHVQSLRSAQQQAREAWPQGEALRTIRRLYHTIKGSGRLVGATAIADFAQAHEQLLRTVIDHPRWRAQAALHALLDQSTPWLLTLSQHFDDPLPAAAHEQMQRCQQLSQQGDLAPPAEQLGPSNTPPRDMPPRDMPHDVPLGESISGDAALGEMSATQAIDVTDTAHEEQAHSDPHDGSISPELAAVFVPEAQQYLERIQQLLPENTALDGGALRPLCDALHSLNGSARTAQIRSVAQLATPAYAFVCQRVERFESLRRGEVALLRRAAIQLSAVLGQLRHGIDNTALGAALATELALLSEASPSAATLSDRDLEGFLDEASEALGQLRDHLQRWDDTQGGREAVLRVLHTLKGSANTVGFRSIGDLAHAMEGAVLQADSLDELPRRTLVGSVHEGVEALMLSLDQLRRGAPLGRFDWLLEDLRFGGGDEDPDLEPWEHWDEWSSTNTATVMEDRDAGGGAAAAVPAPSESTPLTPFTAPIPDNNISHADTAGVASAPASAITASDAWPEDRPDAIPDAIVRDVAKDAAKDAVKEVALDRLWQALGETEVARSDQRRDFAELASAVIDLGDVSARLRRLVRELELGVDHAEPSLSANREDPLQLQRYGDLDILQRALAETSADLERVGKGLRHGLHQAGAQLETQSRAGGRLRAEVDRLRTISLEELSGRLTRVVNTAAQALHKSAQLRIVTPRARIDRRQLPLLTEALEHLLRNAVSHGIENAAQRLARGKDTTGSITLHLHRQGQRCVLELRDDGAGIDWEALRQMAREAGVSGEDHSLLFAGLSSADAVDVLHGRGLGLQAVAAAMTQLQGEVSVESTAQQGTRFSLAWSDPDAVEDLLLVLAGGQHWAVFADAVQASMAPQDDSTPPRSLAAALGLVEETGEATGVVLRTRDGQHWRVQSVVGRREAVVQRHLPYLSASPWLQGAVVVDTGVVVPVLNLQGLQGVRAPAPAQRSDTATIMIIDDSITMRSMTARLLQRHRLHTMSAKDGRDALTLLERAAVEQRLPQLLLLDLEMPHMDGIELLEALRARPALRALAVVVVSARNGSGHRQRVAALGVEHFLGKPYREAQLMALVRRYVQIEE